MTDPPPHSDDVTAAVPGRGSTAGTPRWVTVSGIIAIVLALVVAAVMVFGGGSGEHGPGRHTSEGTAPRVEAPADRASFEGGRRWA